MNIWLLDTSEIAMKGAVWLQVNNCLETVFLMVSVCHNEEVMQAEKAITTVFGRDAHLDSEDSNEQNLKESARNVLLFFLTDKKPLKIHWDSHHSYSLCSSAGSQKPIDGRCSCNSKSDPENLAVMAWHLASDSMALAKAPHKILPSLVTEVVARAVLQNRKSERMFASEEFGIGPNRVSESTVSNTELSEFFGAH